MFGKVYIWISKLDMKAGRLVLNPLYHLVAMCPDKIFKSFGCSVSSQKNGNELVPTPSGCKWVLNELVHDGFRTLATNEGCGCLDFCCSLNDALESKVPPSVIFLTVWTRIWIRVSGMGPEKNIFLQVQDCSYVH